jgi:ATP-dependent protease HslVU (ClpYQ) peptidase subunit
MTCIIGLVKDGVVYMGGDSIAYTDYFDSRTGRAPKVFRIGECLIGFTSSFRMGQILQYHLKLETQGNEPDDRYIVVTFLEAVRACLKTHGYAKVENNQETGGTFLVGYRGNLYKVCDDLSVLQFTDDFDVVGCGIYHAIGAMAALENLPPRRRIKQALKIVARYVPGVSGPFHLETLGEEA